MAGAAWSPGSYVSGIWRDSELAYLAVALMSAAMELDGLPPVIRSVPGQEHAAAFLARALHQPAHSYLFSGPEGSGKRLGMRAFAKFIQHRYARQCLIRRPRIVPPFPGPIHARDHLWLRSLIVVEARNGGFDIHFLEHKART